MPLEIIDQDLFESNAQFICHQINAVTNRAAHLAKAMFMKFPWADVYSERPHPFIPPQEGLPGNIIIRGNGADKRFVIGMIGQFYPGKPRFADSSRDGHLARELAFKKCLDKIANIPDIKSIAFPWQIGCGAAGGNWENYLEMLKHFASETQVPVNVCRLPE